MKKLGDPEIKRQIQQYGKALTGCRPTGVPEIMDLNKGPDSVIKLTDLDCCPWDLCSKIVFLPEKLSEKRGSLVQLYHQDGYQHGNLPFENPIRPKIRSGNRLAFVQT